MSDFIQWVTHGAKRGWFELSSRTAFYLFAPIVVLALVATLYLMLISRTAARGRNIEQLRAELFGLQRENEQLEVDIAIEGTVTRLEERASALGFLPAEREEFLWVSIGVP